MPKIKKRTWKYIVLCLILVLPYVLYMYWFSEETIYREQYAIIALIISGVLTTIGLFLMYTNRLNVIGKSLTLSTVASSLIVLGITNLNRNKRDIISKIGVTTTYETSVLGKYIVIFGTSIPFIAMLWMTIDKDFGISVAKPIVEQI